MAKIKVLPSIMGSKKTVKLVQAKRYNISLIINVIQLITILYLTARL